MIPVGILVEILIVGLFLLIAVSPIYIAVNKRLRNQCGLFPELTELKNSKELVILFLLLVYTMGILGNRLIDDAYEKITDKNSPFKFMKLSFLQSSKWNKDNLKLEIKINDGSPLSNLKNEKKSEIYKVAEFKLMDKSEATKKWLERHKSFIRVLRAGSFSALLFLLCIGIYKLIPGGYPRYSWWFIITIFFLLVLFHFGWRLETYGYQKRVVLFFLKGSFLP